MSRAWQEARVLKLKYSSFVFDPLETVPACRRGFLEISTNKINTSAITRMSYHTKRIPELRTVEYSCS